MTLDRDALRARLAAPSKTWRWNRGGVDGYDAVEVRGDVVRWYRWSHDIAEGVGGAQDEVFQSVDAFLADGPGRKAPPPIVEEVRAFVGQSQRSASP